MSAFFANRRGQPEAAQPEPAAPLPDGRPVGFDTIIGADTKFEGDFSSPGNARLDGEFAGSLDVGGNILIGESADIQADITGSTITIAGRVRGNISGSKVQLLRTCRIWGDISAPALTTEEGAFIAGTVSMDGHVATRPAAAEPPEEAEAPAEDDALETAELEAEAR